MKRLVAADRMGDPEQQHDRHIALAGFDLGDVALGDPGPAGKLAARHVADEAHRPHAVAEQAQESLSE